MSNENFRSSNTVKTETCTPAKCTNSTINSINRITSITSGTARQGGLIANSSLLPSSHHSSTSINTCNQIDAIAAVAVAVAVSSLTAVIIPSNTIVSIAGSTMNEITTTITSTKTTPTPISTLKKDSKKNENDKCLSSISVTSDKLNLQETSNSTSNDNSITSVIMNVTPYEAFTLMDSPKEFDNNNLTQQSTAQDENSFSLARITNNLAFNISVSSHNSTRKGIINDTTTNTKLICSSPQPIAVAELNVINANSKELREDCELKDLDFSQLKNLLEEACNYKNPRDKGNMSKRFLKLLEKVENEDSSYSFCTTNTRNFSGLVCEVSTVNVSSPLESQTIGHLHESNESDIQDIGSLYRNNYDDDVKNTNLVSTATILRNTTDDCIIEIDKRSIKNIQQEQRVLQINSQKSISNDMPYYHRLTAIEPRIPRINLKTKSLSLQSSSISSHCCVDDGIRFISLESNDSKNIGDSITAVDTKYLSLDENYKACKSVLYGDVENSETLLKSKNTSLTQKIGQLDVSNSSNSQRSLDENGNSLNDLFPRISSLGSGTTIHINTVPSLGTNLLNSCSNLSTSATMTISTHSPTHLTLDSARLGPSILVGTPQAKVKSKKKSQQERNTKTVDVESVAGYRGKDPVEELVKYIESSGEDKQGSSTISNNSRGNDKRKDRKKEKEKQKFKKSNSLEELRSGAKLEINDLQQTLKTIESNTILSRQNTKNNMKQKISIVDVNTTKNFNIRNPLYNNNTDVSQLSSEHKLWNTDHLNYLEYLKNADFIDDNSDEGMKRRFKENDHRDQRQEMNTENTGKIFKCKYNYNADLQLNVSSSSSNNILNFPKIKLNKIEGSKIERKSEKFDKLQKRKIKELSTNAVKMVDILPIETVLPETAEFHVVTKKKRNKKTKIINNMEDSTITITRPHNLNFHKSIVVNQYQQQETHNVRCKYQPQDSSITSFNFNNNFNAYISQRSENNYKVQPQFSQNSFEINNIINKANVNSDISRRKSTSSVLPCENSDSSDFDSVHSLPIKHTEYSRIPNTYYNTTTMTATKEFNKMECSDIPVKNILPIPLPVSISYADIARYNRGIPQLLMQSVEHNHKITPGILTKNVSLTSEEEINKNISNGITNMGIPVTSTIKSTKAKKLQSNQDFPELVAVTSVNSYKSISSILTTNITNIISPNTIRVTTALESTFECRSKVHPSNTSVVFSAMNPSSSTMVPSLSNEKSAMSNSKDVKEKDYVSQFNNNISTTSNTDSNINKSINCVVKSTDIFLPKTSKNKFTCSKNYVANNEISSTQTHKDTSVLLNMTVGEENRYYTKNKNNRSECQSFQSIEMQKQEKLTVKNLNNALYDHKLMDIHCTGVDNKCPLMKARCQVKSLMMIDGNQRPPVIILNNDRSNINCDDKNDFIFGDFNEDELRLFQDTLTNGEDLLGMNSTHIKEIPDMPTIQDSEIFNNSEISCNVASFIVNNIHPDVFPLTVNISSHNTTFATRNYGKTSLDIKQDYHHYHMRSHTNSHFSDSSEYIGNEVNNNVVVNWKEHNRNYYQTKNKNLKSTKGENIPSNIFVYKTQSSNNMHNTADYLELPSFQNLETCNSIERAIITAARTAANNQQQNHEYDHQNSKAYNNSQQNFYKHFKLSPETTSFSSSSLTSISTNNYQTNYSVNNSKRMNNYNTNHYNGRNYLCDGQNSINKNNHVRCNMLYYSPQKKFIEGEDRTSLSRKVDNEKKNYSYNYCTLPSHSPSHIRRFTQNPENLITTKDFDISFIPPLSTTSINQRYMDIIIDFIGSAWEEITNNKDTRIYDEK